MLLKVAGNAHAYGWDNLVVGVWDERFHCPAGKSFALFGDGGQWEYQLEKGNLLMITLTNGTLAFSEYHSAGTWILEFDGGLLHSWCIIPPVQ